MFLYSIYDVKAEAYSPPFCAKTDGLATRIVQGGAVQGTSLFEHPEDFSVFRIGSFDELAGTVVGNTPPQFVVALVSLVQKPSIYADLTKENGNGTFGDDSSVFAGSASDDPALEVSSD